MGAERASLVIQTAFLGDTVLTTPLLAELARRGPVDVVVTPGAAPLLQHDPSVRRVFTYDKRGADAGLGGLRRMARRVRDAGGGERRSAYLAQGSARSAALAILAGCRTRVGFDSSAGRWLYTHRVPFRSDRHHAERLWRLAFPENAVAAPGNGALRPRLFPGDEERRAVDALLGSETPQGAAGGARLLALAPGSVWKTKRWPYYGELARRLAGHGRIVIVGGPDDREAAGAILDAVGPAGAVDATGHLTLLASAELIGRAALLVTNDSSPQHLASAMGTPTITLFGPTVPAFGYGPLAPRSVSLGHATLSCRPCHHHGPPECPLRHWRCMRELDVAAVERAALELLDAPA